MSLDWNKAINYAGLGLIVVVLAVCVRTCSNTNKASDTNDEIKKVSATVDTIASNIDTLKADVAEVKKVVKRTEKRVEAVQETVDSIRDRVECNLPPCKSDKDSAQAPKEPKTPSKKPGEKKPVPKEPKHDTVYVVIHDTVPEDTNKKSNDVAFIVCRQASNYIGR